MPSFAYAFALLSQEQFNSHCAAHICKTHYCYESNVLQLITRFYRGEMSYLLHGQLAEIASRNVSYSCCARCNT